MGTDVASRVQAPKNNVERFDEQAKRRAVRTPDGERAGSERLRRALIQADLSVIGSGVHGGGATEPEYDDGRVRLSPVATTPTDRSHTHAIQRAGKAAHNTSGDTAVVESLAGDGSSKITLRGPQGSLGSVNVRALDNTAVEATDLAVTPENRGRGYGQDLVAAAARVGARSGKSRVKLGSQDSGSGKLDGWYQSLGFNKTGKGQDGYTRFEAPTSGLQRHAVQRSTVASPRESASTRLDLSGQIHRTVIRRMEEVELSNEERLAEHDERMRAEESEHQLESWNRVNAYFQDPDGKPPLDQMTMKAAYEEAKAIGQNDLMQQIADLMSSTAKDSQFIEEFDDDVARHLYQNGAGVVLATRFVKEFTPGRNPAISTGLMLGLRQCGLLVIQAVIYRDSAYGANGMKYFLAIRGFTGNGWHKRCLGEWHVHWEAKNKAGSPGWKKGKNGDKTPTGNEMRAILGKELWGRAKGSGSGNWE